LDSHHPKPPICFDSLAFSTEKLKKTQTNTLWGRCQCEPFQSRWPNKSTRGGAIGLRVEMLQWVDGIIHLNWAISLEPYPRKKKKNILTNIVAEQEVADVLQNVCTGQARVGVDLKLEARGSVWARRGLARARLGSKGRQAKPKPWN
jgi:hypothetical protein